MGFKDRIKKMQGDLKERTKESYETKEDKGFSSGSVFIKDKIPEWLGFWNPQPGPHTFDILPWEVGTTHHKLSEGTLAYVLDLWVYSNVGPLNDQFCCPSKMWRDPDPIQEFMVNNRLPKEEWSQKKAKRRGIYLVWVHDSPEEEEKGPQLYDVSHFFMEEKLQEAAEMPEGGGQIIFADWTKNGKTIYFNIKKEGKWTDHTGTERDSYKYVGHKFIDRKNDIPDDILEKLDGLHLDELVKMRPTYEEIETAFKGSSTTKKGSTDKKEPEKKSSSNECPDDGTFGVDCDKLTECEECSKWEECTKEKIRLDLERKREARLKQKEEDYEESKEEETPEETPEKETPEPEKKTPGKVTTTRRKLKIRKRTS